MLFLSLLTACTGTPPEDTAEPVVAEPEEEREPCGELEIRVNGEDPPSVGDTWTILLVCDDAIMTGAQRISWDPLDIATVEDGNTSTFLYAGEAVLTVQAGSQRTSRDVTVSE